MKNFLWLSFFVVIFPINSYSMSCTTLENGKKTTCNNYSNLKQKDPAKLAKLCQAGDLQMGKLVIVNKLSQDSCDPTDAIAKCRRHGADITFYYSDISLDLQTIEKGCKVFKDAELIKL